MGDVSVLFGCLVFFGFFFENSTWELAWLVRDKSESRSFLKWCVWKEMSRLRKNACSFVCKFSKRLLLNHYREDRRKFYIFAMLAGWILTLSLVVIFSNVWTILTFQNFVVFGKQLERTVFFPVVFQNFVNVDNSKFEVTGHECKSKTWACSNLRTPHKKHETSGSFCSHSNATLTVPSDIRHALRTNQIF